jgi:hypothetical protein
LCRCVTPLPDFAHIKCVSALPQIRHRHECCFPSWASRMISLPGGQLNSLNLVFSSVLCQKHSWQWVCCMRNVYWLKLALHASCQPRLGCARDKGFCFKSLGSVVHAIPYTKVQILDQLSKHSVHAKFGKFAVLMGMSHAGCTQVRRHAANSSLPVGPAREGKGRSA